MISLYISSSFVRFQVGGESLEVSCAWGNGLYYFKCGRTHEHLAHVGPALILAMRLRGKRAAKSSGAASAVPGCTMPIAPSAFQRARGDAVIAALSGYVRPALWNIPLILDHVILN